MSTPSATASSNDPAILQRHVPSESDVENPLHSPAPSRPCSPRRRQVMTAIVAIECFLAPVNILSGMMASEGRTWKLIFFCVFLLWVTLLPIALFLYSGLGSLALIDITRSTLWHIGCCILMFYFFSAILQIASDILPQWIPTILDCGLGLSIGLQNLPRHSLHGLKDWGTNVIGSLCGAGGQSILRHETYSLPRRIESQSESEQV